YDGLDLVGSQPIVGGKATLLLSSVSPGIHHFVARYNPTHDDWTGSQDLVIAATQPTVIDLLAVYTPQAQAVRGGYIGAIIQTIRDFVAYTNTVLTNSQIPVTVRLVGVS